MKLFQLILMISAALTSVMASGANHNPPPMSPAHPVLPVRESDSSFSLATELMKSHVQRLYRTYIFASGQLNETYLGVIATENDLQTLSEVNKSKRISHATLLIHGSFLELGNAIDDDAWGFVHLNCHTNVATTFLMRSPIFLSRERPRDFNFLVDKILRSVCSYSDKFPNVDQYLFPSIAQDIDFDWETSYPSSSLSEDKARSKYQAIFVAELFVRALRDNSFEFLRTCGETNVGWDSFKFYPWKRLCDFPGLPFFSGWWQQFESDVLWAPVHDEMEQLNMARIEEYSEEEEEEEEEEEPEEDALLRSKWLR